MMNQSLDEIKYILEAEKFHIPKLELSEEY